MQHRNEIHKECREIYILVVLNISVALTLSFAYLFSDLSERMVRWYITFVIENVFTILDSMEFENNDHTVINWTPLVYHCYTILRSSNIHNLFFTSVFITLQHHSTVKMSLNIPTRTIEYNM